MIPIVLLRRLTRNISNIVLFKVKREYFRNSFSPPTAIWWNKLDNNTWNSESVSVLAFNPIEDWGQEGNGGRGKTLYQFFYCNFSKSRY